jgi:hypothetical protein
MEPNSSSCRNQVSLDNNNVKQSRLSTRPASSPSTMTFSKYSGKQQKGELRTKQDQVFSTRIHCASLLMLMQNVFSFSDGAKERLSRSSFWVQVKRWWRFRAAQRAKLASLITKRALS